jgi:hypothetical protein
MTSRVVYDEARGGHFAESPARGGGVIRTRIDDGESQIRPGGEAVLVDRQPARRARAVHECPSAQVRVHVSANAHHALDAEIFRSADGRELGLFLIGDGSARYPRVWAALPDKSWQRGVDSLLIDSWAEGFEHVCGHAHTHSGPPTASQADRQTWANCRRNLGLAGFVGLVIGVDPADLSVPPTLRAYLTTADGCRPVPLIVQGRN